MKKGLLPVSEKITSNSAKISGVSPFERTKQGRTISKEQFAEVLEKIEKELTDGRAADAEKSSLEILETYSNSIDAQGILNILLSTSLEIQGRYEESLIVLQTFEDEEIIDKLKLETLIKIFVQLANSYTNANDLPKAVALLNSALQVAEKQDNTELLVEIHNVLSRAYRELNEYPISRNYAEKAMRYAREIGDWRGLSESYCAVGVSYYQEGNSQKSLEYFQQAIRIVGENHAPLLLGKYYSDISAAYHALRRPQDGIDSLKKSIALFESIDQKFQLTLAYNNLGINLMLLGNWKKAEETIKHALELAAETNHVFIAVILDSLGELKLLQGETQESEKLFKEAIESAEANKKERYVLASMSNLSGALLAQNKIDEAIKKAEETIERCSRIGQENCTNSTNLVLAESYLKKNNLREAEEILQSLEEKDHASDFLILGNIARLRGLLAVAAKNESLAVQHFNRSLSIFEMAGDFYNTAVAQLKLGSLVSATQPEKAVKYLNSAIETFRKLGIESKRKEAENLLESLKTSESAKPKEQSVSSQLLMLRLAEATASRELLFRELVTILQQEGKAKKTILAEIGENRKLHPSIIDGFTPAESVEIISKLQDAQIHNRLDEFAKLNNLSVFQLRAPSAAPAVLVVYPQSGAILANGSPIQPLLRVVELGMDVCALREKDKESSGENELGAFTSQSLMPGFIHSSPAMTELVEEVYKIRSSDVTVLITGESGTGKELVSRAIHAVSRRKDKVFVPFNCTAVPRELTEGHLFGYKKGAFTGAVSDSPGMIRSAHGGTLFLDEIGDLPLDVQPKILRFLQEGEVQPLGEKSPIKVDVRIIAATNMNLEEKVAQGLFREDLYYRLNVIRLRVPPLRERRSEIPQIVNYYINHYSAKFGRRDLTITPQAMDLLIAYDWTGNVRQLCNEVQRIVARADNGDKVTPKHLSNEIRPVETAFTAPNVSNVRTIGLPDNSINIQTQGGTLEDAVSALEKQMISAALKKHNYNISRVAKELGLTRRGLYMKIERYKLNKTGT